MNPELTRVSAGAENVEPADSEIVGRARIAPSKLTQRVLVNACNCGALSVEPGPRSACKLVAAVNCGRL